MRAHGSVDEVPGAGPADHLCWIYADDGEFDAAARTFITRGLARGERLLCVGERVIEALETMAPPLPDLAGLLARGAIETLSLDAAYSAAGPFGPEQQLAYYAAATQRALDDGYRGLRVLAEVTDLAGDPAQRAELVRWEHLADRYAVHGAGFSAMCAYRADLPPEALADVAAVHPLVHGPGEVSSFQFFVDGDRLALAGSLDTFCSDRLARVLESVSISEDRVVLDLAAVEFVDIGACRTLARWAARLAARAVQLEISGSSGLLRRMWQLLDLDRVAPVTFTGQAPA